MSDDPHILKLRELMHAMDTIPANEQCIGHIQMAVKEALSNIADEFEKLHKVLGMSR